MFDIALGVAYSLALLWLLCGTVYRTVVWLRSRSRFLIPLAPAPRSQAGVFGRLALELLAFRSLARASKITWLASLAFHYGLLWLLIVHLRLVFEILPLFLLPFIQFSAWATLALLVGLSVLLCRRVRVDRIRYISAPSDYLHLVLLISIGISGTLLKRVWPTSLHEVGEFVRGVITFQWTSLPDHVGLILHLLLALILILVFPVSKLVHGVGIVFSPTFNQRDKSWSGMEQENPPVVGRYRVIPILQDGAMAEAHTAAATEKVQRANGLPGALLADWHDKAIHRLGELLRERRGLQVFMDTCTKCGACTDKCHYFLGTADPKNMPVARQDLLRSVYRRYFTLTGKWFPKLVGARDLDKNLLEDWYRYFHQCSECRRCTVYCPKGIDTSEVTMAGREILAAIGLGQQYSQEIIGKVNQVGNNLGMKKPALVDVLESLEEDIADDTGFDIRMPLDKPGADMLVVTPSADFFAEPHVDGLIGMAKVLHAAGIDWTFSSHASEAANFALFTGQHTPMQTIAMRINDAARKLGVTRIIMGECGHAWRVAYSFMDELVGGFDYLDRAHPRPEHICELTVELLQENRIILDPQRNADKVVTFHDSCNVARGAGMGGVSGGQFTLPRLLLKASVPQVIEMHAETTHQKTFCCGGGGGLLTDDLMDVRIKGALPRAQALQAVVDSHSVTHLVAICAICKTQLTQVLPHHDLADVQVTSLHHLVGDALVL